MPRIAPYHGRTRQLSAKLRVSDLSNDTRTNLFTAPQSGNVADYPIRGDVTGSSDLKFLGITTGLIFGDNSLTRFAYKSFSTLAGQRYRISALIRMDDGNAPVPSIASAAGDFSFVIDGNIVGTMLTPVRLTSDIWRCAMELTSAGTLPNNGIAKFTTQTPRSFSVTDYHLARV